MKYIFKPSEPLLRLGRFLGVVTSIDFARINDESLQINDFEHRINDKSARINDKSTRINDKNARINGNRSRINDEHPRINDIVNSRVFICKLVILPRR